MVKAEIQSKIVPILERAHVRKAAIFGSTARGDDTSASDVDILIEMPRPYSLFSFLTIKNDLEDSLQKKVDLIEYGTVKSALRERILNDAVDIL
ncbi:nucleotidyltransferase family protein [Candidatus Kaiserbacteria bacterium]|nr:nucleotidyltransferase family protein [Candidatus Kaiserbacteria bacterium]